MGAVPSSERRQSEMSADPRVFDIRRGASFQRDTEPAGRGYRPRWSVPGATPTLRAGLSVLSNIYGLGYLFEESVAWLASLLIDWRRPPPPVSQYIVTPVGTLGGRASWAAAINNRGQVVGGSLLVDDRTVSALLWDNGYATDLGILPGYEGSTASDINDNGQVVGWASSTQRLDPDGRAINRAFKWDNGVLTPIAELAGDTQQQAFGIDAAGQAVGQSWHGAGATMVSHAFFESAGTVLVSGSLGGRTWNAATAINNHGQVVGHAAPAGDPRVSSDPSSDTQYHAFLYQGGQTIDIGTLGGLVSEALDINSQGTIVGYSATVGDVDSSIDAFMWAQGKITDLGSLGGKCQAKAINDGGTIVGASFDALPYTYMRAVLWSNGWLYDLNELVPADSPWILLGANDINDLGQIVVDAEPKDRQGPQRGLVLTPA